ncbi:MAG: hypothetical protein CVU57_00030 [Deltaproteobacteria bacterium HGW-Deltaproteobacteria-15]|jgi:hypothetical protein|nr:MAG: hypothetical protein CVU57_00030 [Deltaproteobacteria bacterium HGW-Deltaproteobacteria-15]
MTVVQRIRTRRGTKEVDLTPVTAIQAHCRECFAWELEEVKKCTDPMCPLYAFRLGKNPCRRGIGGRPKRKLK